MQQRSLSVKLQAFAQVSSGTVSGFVKNIRNRKTIVFAVFIGISCLYLMSSYLLPAHRHFHISQTQERTQVDECLAPYFAEWQTLIKSSDAVLKEKPGSTKENRFFPFTGKAWLSIQVITNCFFIMKTLCNILDGFGLVRKNLSQIELQFQI